MEKGTSLEITVWEWPLGATEFQFQAYHVYDVFLNSPSVVYFVPLGTSP